MSHYFIPFTLSADLRLFVWGFEKDKAFIRAGEGGTITAILVADSTNPLYEIENAKGKKQAVYRRELIAAGVQFSGVEPCQ